MLARFMVLAGLLVAMGFASNAAAAPGTPTVSHDNWDQDGSYSITWDMWWGENGTSWRLYEDGVPIDEGTLVDASPGAQRALSAVGPKASGTYTYQVTLANGSGETQSAPINVQVVVDSPPPVDPPPADPPPDEPPPTSAVPGTPSVTHDNWDYDGNYAITWHLWWGVNGTHWELYEDGAMVREGDLTAATPSAQSASIAFAGKAAGTYRYQAILRNAGGGSVSNELTVTVDGVSEPPSDDPPPDDPPPDDPPPASLFPATPSVSHDNWDFDGNYAVTWSTWWGENGTSWELYENGALIREGDLTAATPSAQFASSSFSGKAAGTYAYRAVLINGAGESASSAVTVTVDAVSEPPPDDLPPPEPPVATTLPGKATLHHNNSDEDGTYHVGWYMWWGENGTRWRLYEDGAEIASGDLVANTPTHQSGPLVAIGTVEPKARGTYTYTVGLINAAGETSSNPLEVRVGAAVRPAPASEPPPVHDPLPDIAIDGDADGLVLTIEYDTTKFYALSAEGAPDATFTAWTYDDAAYATVVGGTTLSITATEPGLAIVRLVGGGGDRYVGVEVLEADGSYAVQPPTPTSPLSECGACEPPLCMCPSTHPPGGLAPGRTPQFVFLTFDDGVTTAAYQAMMKVVDQAGDPPRNPDGTSLRATFFVSLDNTQHHLVRALYERGHEIGDHTWTHTTGAYTDAETWEAEIVDSRAEIAYQSDIPTDEIVGFRAPYLEHTDDSFRVLHENGFLYDTSMLEFLDDESLSQSLDTLVWPYTFDHGSGQFCWVGECPAQPYPGLWEIPMWDLHTDDGVPYSSMDPVGDHDELVALFKGNFLPRYLGNRAPMGIFLHAGWLMASDDHITALNEFLSWAEGLDDVWFVTNSELLTFMMDPRDKDDVASLFPHPIPCGYQNRGTVLTVAEGIEICVPSVTCDPSTCPPDLGSCVDGACVFNDDYQGLRTLPEAWATHYCDLANEGCHGVTQINFPEETAALVSAGSGLPLCGAASSGDAKCVGIVASSPMMVGNSQEAIDPGTGAFVRDWGQGMTEASGLCYEVTGPGGTALVAVTDRCAGYASCNGSGYQEAGPCINADDLSPNCACVGDVPGLFDECCGVGCSTVQQACDWCASNNHPHFDMDVDAFNWVCGDDAIMGSCQLSVARFVECLDPDPNWPPFGSPSECLDDTLFFCRGESPSPEQPVVPGTDCCCSWGKEPLHDGTCG